MRTWLSPLLGIMLILAMMAAVPVSAQEGDGETQKPEDPPGQGQGRGNGNTSDDNKTQGNANAQMRSDSRTACRQALDDGDDNVSQPDHPCYPYYRGNGRGASDDVRRDYQEEYARGHERAAESQAGRMSSYVAPGEPFGFGADATGYHGDHLSFIPLLGNHTVHDIRYDGVLLAVAIEAPGPVREDNYLRGVQVKFQGDDADWKLDFTDRHPRTQISLRTGDDTAPFILTLPSDATLTETEPGHIARIQYADSGLSAQLRYSEGDIQPLPTNATNDTAPRVYLATGVVLFMVEGSEPDQVANDRGNSRAFQNAWLQGQLGAEIDVRRAVNEGEIAALTTVYNDMELLFEAPPLAGDADSTYTITVDSPAHEGKTIALNMESGLVDPQRLAFRYYNVLPNLTVPATIMQADDIHDVLDPLDDGVVAEWWIVQDLNGVQVLISIPHFSIHKIELQTLGEIIVEQPSLVAGVLGAVLVVGIATRAMFRNPRDE